MEPGYRCVTHTAMPLHYRYNDYAAAADRLRIRHSELVVIAARPHRTAMVSVTEFDEEGLFAELTDPDPGQPRRPSALPGGRANRDMLASVWTAFSTFVQKQLEQSKAVNIPNFGRFTFLVKSAKKKEPVFIWNPNFLSQYGVKARSVPRGAIDPAKTDVNYSMVAMLASISKDDATIVLKELLRLASQKMGLSAEDPAVRLRLKLFNVGRFCCDRFGRRAPPHPPRPAPSPACRRCSAAAGGGPDAAAASRSQRDVQIRLRRQVGLHPSRHLRDLPHRLARLAGLARLAARRLGGAARELEGDERRDAQGFGRRHQRQQ
eukprot:SAG11_NODE_190_length_12980_cov_11.633802_16_plen_320_part_00